MAVEPNRRELIKGAGVLAMTAVLPPGNAFAVNEAEPNPLPNLEYRTATELVAALAGKRISSVQLTDFSISRIEATLTSGWPQRVGRIKRCWESEVFATTLCCKVN
jgi:hypothetical protein